MNKDGQIRTQGRQPMVFLVCGETGVGKTYRNKHEIKRYLLDNYSTGKRGRKVLCFDTNDDDYPEYLTVGPDHIHRLKQIRARRIRPFNPGGIPMDEDEKRGVVSNILKYFSDGMIVLDDIDHYMTGAKGQAMIGALCTVRHKGIDLLLTHQSIAKISTTEWQNCTWLRLHHQVDDVTRYRERIPKYNLVRIAQLIIDEQYEAATRAFTNGQIQEFDYRIHKSFFVYVNMREQKIRGCSRASFIRAARKYIDQEESKKLRLMLNERKFGTNEPVYRDRNEAMIKLISDYLRFHDTKPENPFVKQVA